MKSGFVPNAVPAPQAMREVTALRRACWTARAPAPDAVAMAAVASAVRFAVTTTGASVVVGAGVEGMGRV